MTALWFGAVFFASPTHSNGVDVVEERDLHPCPCGVSSLVSITRLEGISRKPQFLLFEVFFS